MKRRVLGAPLAVQINVTGACNLACCHCSAAVLRHAANGEELGLAAWRDVLERLRKAGVVEVNFTGGEPFLRSKAIALVEAAAALRFPKVTLQTNATLIRGDLARRLARAVVRTVAVSVDGIPDTHDRIRGHRGAFNAAASGIKAMVAEGLHVVVQMTAMTTNVAEVEEVVRLVETMGVREFGIRRLVAQGPALEHYQTLRLNPDQTRELAERMRTIRKAHPAMKISYNQAVFECDQGDDDTACAVTPGNRVWMKACSAAHSTCAITADGYLIPCAMLTGFRAGNVRDGDIIGIWRKSDVFQEIRRLSDLTMDDVAECRHCRLRPVCDGGCRGHAFNLFGDLVSPNPDCHLRQPRPFAGGPHAPVAASTAANQASWKGGEGRGEAAL